MNSPQLTIALLAAGISLALGLVSFFTGFHKDGEKTDIMCICMFTFFVIPPTVFILADHAPKVNSLVNVILIFITTQNKIK